MAYTPDPTDVTQPTEAVYAVTAAAEFRALKSYLKGLVLAQLQQGPGMRQVALSGSVDSNGQANALSAGAGLAINLAATNDPLVLTYAAGSNALGDVNYTETVSANVTGLLTLAASNRSYISKLYGGAWDKTLAPPQYGYAYDRSRQAVLNFDGTNGSTSMIDDFGNAWTAVGGAKLQNTWSKFGGTALGGAGGSNQLNGSADYIQSTDITHPNKDGGSWSMRCWVRLTVLPGSGAATRLLTIVQGTQWGAELLVYNNAGVIKFAYGLSSNGSSYDIANLVVGTTTPVINTDYFVELTYDEVAGVYRLYVNGVQESSTASALKVCPGTQARIGFGNGVYLNGYIDAAEFLPYCDHPAGTTYAVPTAAPDSLATNYASDFFDIGRMKMWRVTGKSTASGVNPTFTNVNELYAGEAVTGAAAVSSAITYAYRGRAESGLVALQAANGTLSYNHNIGVPQLFSNPELINLSPDAGYVVGDRVDLRSIVGSTGLANSGVGYTRLSSYLTQNAAPYLYSRGVGATTALTATKWSVRHRLSRVW